MINGIIIFLFALAPFFDPVGANFGIRWISITLMFFLFLNIEVLKIKFNTYQFLILIFICFVIPIHGLLISFIYGGLISKTFLDTSYIAFSLLFLASIPLIINLKNYNIFYRSVLKISMATCALSILIFINLFGVEQLENFLTERSIAIIAERGMMGINIEMIYFLSAPLFFIPLAYYANKSISIKSKIIYILIPFLALLLTGTRSHILLGIMYVAWMTPNIILKSDKAENIFVLKSIIFLLSISLAIIFIDFDLFFKFLEAPKRVALMSYYGDVFNNPLTLLFGQGFNAISWDYDLLTWTGGASKLELTYLEYIRVFGIISFLIFIGLYLYLLISLLKNKNYIELHFLLLTLINSSINPYLFSINGIVPLVLALGKVNTNER